MSRLSPNDEFEDVNSVASTSFNDATLGTGDLTTVIVPATDSPASVSSAIQNSGDTQPARKYSHEGGVVYKTDQLEQVIRLFQQATELDSNYGQALSDLGLVYRKNGNIAETIWANRRAISLASGANAATARANSYYSITKIYEAAGQDANALQHYQLALHDTTL